VASRAARLGLHRSPRPSAIGPSSRAWARRATSGVVLDAPRAPARLGRPPNSPVPARRLAVLAAV